MTAHDVLLRKIQDRSATVAVVGLGYVGLPLAVEFAKVVKAKKFVATTDDARLGEADAISIAVPTPLGKTRDPDMSYVQAAANTVAKHSHTGACSSCSRARRIRGRRAR
jgi:UDP-N-acetyl-D-glucosamine dehydrogenase